MSEPWQRLITSLSPKSSLAEAFRILRTNTQFAAVGKPLQTILVTSAGSLEGKSTTVANLGVALAQSGAKVILVDADLRRPSLHQFFRLQKGSGLTTVLMGRDLDRALEETGIEGLRLLTSGPIPPNPSEMLGSPAFANLIEALRARADYVILDSPPAIAVTDANIIASMADGTLLVVEIGKTARQFAVRTKEQLAQSKANIIGVVLTNVSKTAEYNYYYYYYQYPDKA